MSRNAALLHNAKIAWDGIHNPGATRRVTSALLKVILLQYGDNTFFEGQSMKLVKRSLGAGVYEIKLGVPK